MRQEVHREKLRFGREDLILETGKIAKSANGSVIVQYGGTVVLVTACISKEPKEDIGFLPFTVEYQEKTYAAGRIPGGFFKREGKPSESEILTSRLIDRPLRPLFPKGFPHEVQIMSIVLSSDGENHPDVLSIIGGSCALCISDIPFLGPLGAVRVGYIDKKLILNPTYQELEKSDLDMVISGTRNGIIMIEGKANEASEELIRDAVEFGFSSLIKTIEIQEELMGVVSKSKMKIEYRVINSNLSKLVKEYSEDKLEDIFKLSKKEQREEAIDFLCKELEEKLTNYQFSPQEIRKALIEVEREKVRRYILEKDRRIDGRALNEIRPVSCEVGVLPRTHGSSLFTRGQTQSLAVTTLGTRTDEQLIEALEGEKFKSFMLHYSFPPFSVGEVSPVRGPGRREIGHGALAERSLIAVMPKKEDFPYTVRVVSEILESNGSSSMATVCAASLALMDAGVPIREAVSGVAIGLVRENDKICLLTDITGLEDHFGDMDFKIAGTRKGVTSLQLDIKIEGIDSKILYTALKEAKLAREFILLKMSEAIQRPRESISSFAPRITQIKTDPAKIGDLIGPGGKTIRKIINSCNVTIDIGDDGNILISSQNNEGIKKAIEMISAVTEEIRRGKIYWVKVTRIVPFGAFVEILPSGKEGLIHISELADFFIKNIEDVVKIGDEVRAKVINIDEFGRISLSKKQVNGTTFEIFPT